MYEVWSSGSMGSDVIGLSSKNSSVVLLPPFVAAVTGNWLLWVSNVRKSGGTWNEIIYVSLLHLHRGYVNL